MTKGPHMLRQNSEDDFESTRRVLDILQRTLDVTKFLSQIACYDTVTRKMCLNQAYKVLCSQTTLALHGNAAIKKALEDLE